MKVKELVQEVELEITQESKEKAKRIIRERLLEIQAMRKVLDNAEKHLQKLLEMDVVDIASELSFPNVPVPAGPIVRTRSCRHE